jgi:hypothetical protein
VVLPGPLPRTTTTILSLTVTPVDKDDLVEVASDGTVRPVGDRAALRLQARPGAFAVMPSPPHIVFMKSAGAGPGPEPRACMLSGELRSAGALCDVLSFVGHAGWRGEFVVHEADSVRSIFFDQGDVVGATSTVVRERLGEVLYGHGLLSREQLTKCSDATATGQLRFGEAAVKFGFVSRERLFDLMSHQTEEIFYGMMLLGSATFYFLEGYEDHRLAVRQKLSMTALLRDGIQRMHETRYFRARVPTPEHVPTRVPGWKAPDADPSGVYAAIDGERSVLDICRIVGTGEFEVTRALFQLAQSGRVVVKPPRLPVRDVVAVFNEAIALILRELDAMDEGDVVREQLVKYVAERDSSSLLAGAGPADDGTYDPAKVDANVAAAGGGASVLDRLAVVLHQCASYALFLARPHLRRMEEARTGRRPRLSQRITEMLAPIAPKVAEAPEGDAGKGT